jgi:hypothetical protein
MYKQENLLNESFLFSEDLILIQKKNCELILIEFFSHLIFINSNCDPSSRTPIAHSF